MQSIKNYLSVFVLAVNLYFFLILILAISVLVSCKSENENLIESEPTNGFNQNHVNHSAYIHSSIPYSYLDKSQLSLKNRANIYWYTIAPSDVKVSDIIDTEIKLTPALEQIYVLDILFNPLINGVYNTEKLSGNPQNNWGGLYKNLSLKNLNPDGSKNMMMKLWIKIVESSPDAVLNIDLGEISEEVIPNGVLDTEDLNGNDLLDEKEDVGIDKLSSKFETGYTNINPDPNKDDYYFQLGKNDYSHINGTEGNGLSIDYGKKPDSEDLNKNYVLNLNNNYNSYQIPLDESRISKNRIIRRGKNGWIQVKLPIDLPDLTIGKFDNKQYQTLRFWLSNADKQIHIRIAEITFEEI